MHLHDVMAPETRDIDVALEANRRDAILVTKDEDFVDLSRRGILVAPLLWIRSGNTTNARLWEMLAPLLPTIEQALGTGDKIIEVR